MNFWWLDDRILIHVIFSHRQFNNSNVHISKSIAILKAITFISIQMGSISLTFKKKTYTTYWATNYLDSLEAPNILLLCRLLFRLCLESFIFLSKNRWWPNYYSFIFIYIHLFSMYQLYRAEYGKCNDVHSQYIKKSISMYRNRFLAL